MYNLGKKLTQPLQQKQHVDAPQQHSQRRKPTKDATRH
jgi:hypothetical protein